MKLQVNQLNNMSYLALKLLLYAIPLCGTLLLTILHGNTIINHTSSLSIINLYTYYHMFLGLFLFAYFVLTQALINFFKSYDKLELSTPTLINVIMLLPVIVTSFYFLIPLGLKFIDGNAFICIELIVIAMAAMVQLLANFVEF